MVKSGKYIIFERPPLFDRVVEWQFLAAPSEETGGDDVIYDTWQYPCLPLLGGTNPSVAVTIAALLRVPPLYPEYEAPIRARHRKPVAAEVS